MTTEQLTGLKLAVKLLAQIGDDDSDRAIAAVHDLAEERDELRARLAEIEVQEPVAYYRGSDAEWLAARGYMTVSGMRDGNWDLPLYTAPAPVQAVPDGWRLVLTAAPEAAR